MSTRWARSHTEPPLCPQGLAGKEDRVFRKWSAVRDRGARCGLQPCPSPCLTGLLTSLCPAAERCPCGVCKDGMLGVGDGCWSGLCVLLTCSHESLLQPSLAFTQAYSQPFLLEAWAPFRRGWGLEARMWALDVLVVTSAPLPWGLLRGPGPEIFSNQNLIYPSPFSNNKNLGPQNINICSHLLSPRMHPK